MVKLPKFRYLLALAVLVTILTGCELRRSDDDLSDPGPVSDLPPTLAPLGAETDLVVEATPIPTIINVQPTATQSTLGEGQAADSSTELTAPTSQPVDLSGSTVVSDKAVEEAASVAPESFVPPVEEATVEESEPVVEEAIVVDATTSEDLPIGGPVAANPPASETSGDYGIAYGDTTYHVQPGDTLFSIALRYGTSVQAITLANGLYGDMIYAGQVLNIPGDDSSYTAPAYQQPYMPDAGQQNQHIVVPGETLYRIALQYGTSVEAIAGVNGIAYPYLIQAGQQLIIPAPGAYAGPPPPPPAGGYYQQPYQDYPVPDSGGYYEQPYQTPDTGGYYEQPYQGYPAPDDGYAPAPGNTGTHTVAPGETLYSIALRYGTTADTLAAANGLFNPNQIYVGQVLYLP